MQKLPWKVFFATFAAMFIMVVLKNAGVRTSLPNLFHFALINPVSSKASIFDSLLPQLDQKQNTYHLKEQSSLVTKASAAEDYDNATAYIVTNFATGEVIDSKNISQQVPIASLTKLMTAVVSLDLASPNELFTATEKAANVEPTRIGVVAGERLTLEELVEAMLMTSANDAAQTVKDGIDAKYGQSVFIDAMNAKAKAIGLTNTHFANPQGFDDPGNYSSVQDLAILSHYALTNYPLIAKIVTQDYVFLPANQYHKQFDLYNWNGLLDVYPNVDGVKIGNTDAAQTTMIVTSSRGGERLLTVVLGAPDILHRDLWAAELLDDGYTKTLGLPPINVTTDQLYAKYATWKYGN